MKRFDVEVSVDLSESYEIEAETEQEAEREALERFADTYDVEADSSSLYVEVTQCRMSIWVITIHGVMFDSVKGDKHRVSRITVEDYDRPNKEKVMKIANQWGYKEVDRFEVNFINELNA